MMKVLEILYVVNITQGYITYTIIYRDNGDILVFGDNKWGQLGLGHDEDINTPTLLINDKNIRNIICGEYYPRLPKVTQGYPRLPKVTQGYPRLRDLRYLYNNI